MAENKGSPLIENAFAGIVITAQTFNPSIFTESWLTQNDMLQPEAFVGLRVFSAEVAQFQTAQLQVLVIPPKMQITFSMEEGSSEIPRKIAARVVELLPHTPYQALGLNFDFFVAQPSNQDFGVYNRTLLGGGNCKLMDEFRSPDARFGRYFSKDYGQARLKLDIKPVKAGPQAKDLLQLSFNFHHQLSQLSPGERVAKLVELIAGWDSLCQYARHLVQLGSTA